MLPITGRPGMFYAEQKKNIYINFFLGKKKFIYIKVITVVFVVLHIYVIEGFGVLSFNISHLFLSYIPA